MKLVKNGEIGVLVDASYIETLKTPESIEDEIVRITLSDFDPVVRDNNTVVDPLEYVDYLNQRKQSVMAKQVERSIIPTPKPVEVTNTDSKALGLELEIERRNVVIAKLLKIAKSSESNTTNVVETLEESEPVFYNGTIDYEFNGGNTSIKGPIRSVIVNVSNGQKVSVFANIAMARGLFSDDKARELSDELYGEGMYDLFLKNLGGNADNGDSDSSE